MNIGIAADGIFGRDIIRNRTANLAIGCAVFVVLMVLGAYVRIPLFFTPVPITLQTFFVLLSGALLGRKWGAISQAAYLSIGAFGLPVFQGYGSGASHIFGPTGGYLFGFIAASYVAGLLIGPDNRKAQLKIAASMAASLAVIYTFGVIWLKLFLGVSFSAALVMGLYPFLPGAAIKLIAASYVYNFTR